MRKYLDGLLGPDSKDLLRITCPLPVEAIAFYLAQKEQRTSPQLVILENEDRVREFADHFHFWSQETVQSLPHYDPPVYSGVELLPRQRRARLSWLYKAQNSPLSSVFVATIHGITQKTLSPELFFDHCFEFHRGDSLPDDFINTLHTLGYTASPMVEDPGQFSNRGGLIDIFSPQMSHPVRIELFGQEIESLRHYDPNTQRTVETIESFSIAPAREVLLNEKTALRLSQRLLSLKNPELLELVSALRRQEYGPNLDYYVSLIDDINHSALDYFAKPPTLWLVDQYNIETSYQKELAWMDTLDDPERHPLRPNELFVEPQTLSSKCKKVVALDRITIVDNVATLDQREVELAAKALPKPQSKKWNEQVEALITQIQKLPSQTVKIIGAKGTSQYNRLKVALESQQYRCVFIAQNPPSLNELFNDQLPNTVFFFDSTPPSSFFLPSEEIAVISTDHFFGKTGQKRLDRNGEQRAGHLSFGELKPKDYIVHSVHGICQFIGLETMSLAGVDAEFLVLEFKDKDKLFLPIYRIHQIHKFSTDRSEPSLDKLGGSRFSQIKTKTKNRLREMAHDLIKLYAERMQTSRPTYDVEHSDIYDFFNAFPYQETEDQLSAIEDLIKDFTSPKPMDRLICGDVGFGKTEVAMRAAFIAAHNKRQVAVLAPTTVLTMQHLETFQKRFKDWPIQIRVVNRIQTTAQVKKTLHELREGQVDILIGTHRLLSQDVEYKDLGLLIVDEEQKFGVKHKEKIRKMKKSVDTLSLSATPIPRTLNMSLLKIRDLSLINTAPVDRLEIRTFICRHDKEIIKRAVETEMERGGQVFFLHNRVQSIYSVADELRQLLPKVPIAVGHGQLPEKELESVMLSFFHNETKLLVSSAIIESGVDVTNANTILINQADNFGLSQLYQLRGRVGRSGRRGYCYLLTEPNKKLTDIAKERLRVIQENSSLGSGLQIAQYDLELRGAGTLLGEEQSGLIDNLGYEYYMQLLEEALNEIKNGTPSETIEPEINLKIKAFIPHQYINNIRIRLSYYRALTQIQSADDIDKLEEELKDQFGKPPEEVINLLGLMLIRRLCIDLGVKDISSGPENLVLSFTESTRLSPKVVVGLTLQQNKKYSITPDNRLKIRMKEITWPRVLDEVEQLLRLCP